jgi:uncharacterized membrane protein
VFAKIKASYFYELISYFIIYSFMGWSLETSVIFIQYGYIEERGFIFGPFCIIYGFGMLLLIILPKPIRNKTLLYFIFSTILITALEYFTGFALEAIFNKRWWDYSHLPLNLNGYICFRISILWGILATTVSKYFHPRLEILVKKFNTASPPSLVILIPIFLITNILISILYNL